jgi:CDP-glucose 4,6-dehydratase
MSPTSFNGAWNFGPDESDAYSVNDVAKQAIKIWGSGEIKIDAPVTQVHEAGLLHLNCDKARKEMNWHPRWDFDQTMSNTVSWYRDVNKGESVREISEFQITKYMENKQ